MLELLIKMLFPQRKPSQIPEKVKTPLTRAGRGGIRFQTNDAYRTTATQIENFGREMIQNFGQEAASEEVTFSNQPIRPPRTRVFDRVWRGGTPMQVEWECREREGYLEFFLRSEARNSNTVLNIRGARESGLMEQFYAQNFPAYSPIELQCVIPARPGLRRLLARLNSQTTVLAEQNIISDYRFLT